MICCSRHYTLQDDSCAECAGVTIAKRDEEIERLRNRLGCLQVEIEIALGAASDASHDLKAKKKRVGELEARVEELQVEARKLRDQVSDTLGATQ